jgi:hypothetical protein
MPTSLSPDIVVQGKPSEGQPHHRMWKFLANMPLVTETCRNTRNARNDVLGDGKSPSSTTTSVLCNDTPNIVESECEG